MDLSHAETESLSDDSRGDDVRDNDSNRGVVCNNARVARHLDRGSDVENDDDDEEEDFVDAIDSIDCLRPPAAKKRECSNGNSGGSNSTLEGCGRWLMSIPRDDVLALQQTSEYIEFLAAFDKLGEVRSVSLFVCPHLLIQDGIR